MWLTAPAITSAFLSYSLLLDQQEHIPSSHTVFVVLQELQQFSFLYLLSSVLSSTLYTGVKKKNRTNHPELLRWIPQIMHTVTQHFGHPAKDIFRKCPQTSSWRLEQLVVLYNQLCEQTAYTRKQSMEEVQEQVCEDCGMAWHKQTTCCGIYLRKIQ